MDNRGEISLYFSRECGEKTVIFSHEALTKIADQEWYERERGGLPLTMREEVAIHSYDKVVISGSRPSKRMSIFHAADYFTKKGAKKEFFMPIAGSKFIFVFIRNKVASSPRLQGNNLHL